MGEPLNLGDGRVIPEIWDRIEVDPDSGCWNWTGWRNRNGYAIFRNVRISRHLLTVASGPPGPGRIYALHSCDNPPCVNPEHLRWGTPQDNVDDMFARGRSALGSRSTETHCRNGHSWAESGFFITSKGEKVCSTCRSEYYSSWNRRRKDPEYQPPRKDDFEHGTVTYYQWGCRCDPCRIAKAQDHKARSVKLKGVYTEHGVTTSYTRGCRCDPCRKAKSDSDKAAYQRKKEREGKFWLKD